MKILVIDNDPRWLGFTALLGCDTATGGDCISTDGYDTVVLSAQLIGIMPDHPRVLVATSTPNSAEAITAFRAGAADYFTKDFRREQFSATIGSE